MRFICEHCEKPIAIDDTEGGNDVKCDHCGEATEVPMDRYEPRAIIHDFALLRSLGQGKTGPVYQARQLSLNREVAIRLLRGDLSISSDIVVGLFREAQAAARLNHTNIAQCHDVGDDDGIFFQAMEYVDGKTLLQLITEQGEIPIEQALDIFTQAAGGLDFAWQNQQMVFRAFSPVSIMVTHGGIVKLVDFSHAYIADQIDSREAEKLLITPYTCPEDIAGDPVDVRSDIYSLGATMYHAVTGIAPYRGATPEELTEEILDDRPRPAIAVMPEMPERVSLIIQKMMARIPEHRYETPAAVVDELRRTAISMA